MSKRDKFVARMKLQLDEVKEDLHKLESAIGNAQAGVRDKYRKSIEELREKRLVVETKLDEIEHSGEEAWEDLKDETERAWTAFKAGVEVLRKFSDHS